MRWPRLTVLYGYASILLYQGTLAITSTSSAAFCIQSRSSDVPGGLVIVSAIKDASAVAKVCNASAVRPSVSGSTGAPTFSSLHEDGDYRFGISERVQGWTNMEFNSTLCTRLIGNIISECIDKASFWGGWSLLDGLNYSISDTAWPDAPALILRLQSSTKPSLRTRTHQLQSSSRISLDANGTFTRGRSNTSLRTNVLPSDSRKANTSAEAESSRGVSYSSSNVTAIHISSKTVTIQPSWRHFPTGLSTEPRVLPIITTAAPTGQNASSAPKDNRTLIYSVSYPPVTDAYNANSPNVTTIPVSGVGTFVFVKETFSDLGPSMGVATITRSFMETDTDGIAFPTWGAIMVIPKGRGGGIGWRPKRAPPGSDRGPRIPAAGGRPPGKATLCLQPFIPCPTPRPPGPPPVAGGSPPPPAEEVVPFNPDDPLTDDGPGENKPTANNEEKPSDEPKSEDEKESKTEEEKKSKTNDRESATISSKPMTSNIPTSMFSSTMSTRLTSLGSKLTTSLPSSTSTMNNSSRTISSSRLACSALPREWAFDDNVSFLSGLTLAKSYGLRTSISIISRTSSPSTKSLCPMIPPEWSYGDDLSIPSASEPSRPTPHESKPATEQVTRTSRPAGSKRTTTLSDVLDSTSLPTTALSSVHLESKPTTALESSTSLSSMSSADTSTSSTSSNTAIGTQSRAFTSSRSSKSTQSSAFTTISLVDFSYTPVTKMNTKAPSATLTSGTDSLDEDCTPFWTPTNAQESRDASGMQLAGGCSISSSRSASNSSSFVSATTLSLVDFSYMPVTKMTTVPPSATLVSSLTDSLDEDCTPFWTPTNSLESRDASGLDFRSGCNATSSLSSSSSNSSASMSATTLSLVDFSYVPVTKMASAAPAPTLNPSLTDSVDDSECTPFWTPMFVEESRDASGLDLGTGCPSSTTSKPASVPSSMPPPSPLPPSPQGTPGILSCGAKAYFAPPPRPYKYVPAAIPREKTDYLIELSLDFCSPIEEKGSKREINRNNLPRWAKMFDMDRHPPSSIEEEQGMKLVTFWSADIDPDPRCDDLLSFEIKAEPEPPGQGKYFRADRDCVAATEHGFINGCDARAGMEKHLGCRTIACKRFCGTGMLVPMNFLESSGGPPD